MKMIPSSETRRTVTRPAPTRAAPPPPNQNPVGNVESALAQTIVNGMDVLLLS